MPSLAGACAIDTFPPFSRDEFFGKTAILNAEFSVVFEANFARDNFR